MIDTPERGIIPNWSMVQPVNVVVSAIRFVDEGGMFLYKPLFTFFMTEDMENPTVISLYGEQIFDCSVQLAKELTTWANTMWGRTSRLVSVIDRDTGEMIVKHNVVEILQREIAIRELEEIKRTNTLIIH